jgi:type IV pilus assembly protein PilN
VIKINLLPVDRARSRRKAAVVVGSQAVTIGASLMLLVAALGVGWWYWSLQNESREIDRQIADAQRETVRLQSVIQQVELFESRRAQLQQRVTLIEELRKGQTGPVHLLDQVSQSLPGTMWLMEVKETGSDVAIDGRCMSLTALSDFVSGLETSDYFERPVEIVDSVVEPGSATTPELIRFSVKAKFKAPAK